MMLIQSVLYFITVTLVLGDNNVCDTAGILIYEDLGCTPEYENASKCPTKYSCKGLEKTKEHCYFRGKSYQNREAVDNLLSSPSCSVACYCSTDENESSFRCAILDCPEWLGVPVKPGCYRNYSLDHCCSTGQICPPFDNNAKCTVNGHKYREGERFSPENTCIDCVCQKGFEGKFEEPFCRRRSCGQQLRRVGSSIQDSCAAFYQVSHTEDILCCPEDWICPDGSEKIVGDGKSENVCKFGDKNLKVGQSFEKNNVTDSYGRVFETMKCECVVPPLVRCTSVEK